MQTPPSTFGPGTFVGFTFPDQIDSPDSSVTGNITISGPDSVCSGESIMLTANGADTYQWSGASNSTSSTIVVSPGSSSNYIVNGTVSGCPAQPDSITISVLPNPSVSITGEDTICASAVVTLSAVSIGASSFQWSGGSSSTNAIIYPVVLNTTEYVVTASNGNCSSSDSMTVYIADFDDLDFVSIYDSCSGAFNFNVQNQYNNVYWDFGDGSTSDVLSPSHFYSPGTYNVTLVAGFGGCTDSTTKVLTVINPSGSSSHILPNVFTPNNDGFNDELKFSGLDRCRTYSLTIYNRWGQVVYETTDAGTEFWNGKNGTKEEQIAGVYFYLLTASDNSSHIIKGSVNLIR
jgi:gliding motility-associated-like protein